jgi:hypothetical protein
MFARFFSLFCFVSISFLVNAQKSIPTGNWRVHVPYSNAFQLTETPTDLLVIARYGSFLLNKEDASIKRLSKVEGFSDVQMNVARYNYERNILVIAYQNGNIDLVKNNQIVNISDILDDNLIQGEKIINHIHFYKQFAYLSTSFGLLALDLDKEEIKESYTNIGPGGSKIDIKASVTLGDSIYIATPEGIFAALNKSSVILGQFTNWNLLGPSKGANHIATFNNQLYADPDTNFSVYTSGGWQDVEADGRDTLTSLEVNHGKLIAAQRGSIQIYNTNGLEQSLAVNLVDKAIQDEEGQVWFVVNGIGLVKKGATETLLLPNGPSGGTSFGMLPVGNDLWVMGGGYNRGFDPLFDNIGYYQFTEGRWKNRGNNPLTDNMRDFTHPAYSKNLNELVIATQSTGILSFDPSLNPKKVYDESNSSLRKNPANGFLICNGAAFDEKDVLWVSNPSNRDSSLVARTKGETWINLRIPARGGKIVVDENNYKWIITPQSNSIGIIVYDDNNTPTNRFDDRYKILNTAEGQGNLINNNVVSLALDKDGEMWIGTTQGICVIRNPSRIFGSPGEFDSERLIITQGNNTDYLLGDEVINDIEIDGGNRKWIATRRGVFHITDNGDSILRRFNAENSPLLDNLVLTVGISPTSGEVFFGTQEGIISYRGDATEPVSNFDNIKIFPNPVNSGYTGAITITNLKDNTLLKLTDLSGQLVYEGKSNGGTFIWNGKNLNGERVSSGVYFVFVADDKVEETNIAKILFLK